MSIRVLLLLLFIIATILCQCRYAAAAVNAIPCLFFFQLLLLLLINCARFRPSRKKQHRLSRLQQSFRPFFKYTDYKCYPLLLVIIYSLRPKFAHGPIPCCPYITFVDWAAVDTLFILRIFFFFRFHHNPMFYLFSCAFHIWSLLLLLFQNHHLTHLTNDTPYYYQDCLISTTQFQRTKLRMK